MSEPDTLLVLAASYDDLATAEADYEAVKALYREIRTLHDFVGLPRAFVDRMYDHTDAGTNRAVLSLYRTTDNPGAAGRRHADALAPLDRPALVVWGAHDPYIPVALAERQREAFPSAEIAILEDSGHWPFADDPDGVGRHVEPFLRGTVGAARADARDPAS